MKAQSTLTEPIGSPDDADQARYQAILADIRADLETYPPPLQALAQPIFEGLASSEMSQVIAPPALLANRRDLCSWLG